MLILFFSNDLFLPVSVFFSGIVFLSSVNEDNDISIKGGDNDSELNRKKSIKNFAKFYNDPANQIIKIREDNNGKIGVYALVNNINKKVYVGSGDPLYTRLSDYYQSWYLISRSNLYIVRAFNKYTMANFSLYILEYTNSDNIILCEQKWINIINPEYNTNPVAGNSKGYKHTYETLEKMRSLSLGRTHTEEVKHLMSENRKGENNPFFGKKHNPETIKKLK